MRGCYGRGGSFTPMMMEIIQGGARMADDRLFEFLAVLMTILICTPGSLLIPAIGIAFCRRWFRQQRRSMSTEDAP